MSKYQNDQKCGYSLKNTYYTNWLILISDLIIVPYNYLFFRVYDFIWLHPSKLKILNYNLIFVILFVSHECSIFTWFCYTD